MMLGCATNYETATRWNDLGVMACVGGFCHYLYFMISSKMQRNIAKYRSM